MPEAREKWWKGKKGCKANRVTKDRSGAIKVTDDSERSAGGGKVM